MLLGDSLSFATMCDIARHFRSAVCINESSGCGAGKIFERHGGKGEEKVDIAKLGDRKSHSMLVVNQNRNMIGMICDLKGILDATYPPIVIGSWQEFHGNLDIDGDLLENHNSHGGYYPNHTTSQDYGEDINNDHSYHEDGE